MIITFLFLSYDKILYILKKIRLYKYLPRYITNNRFFENCISYINPKYIFFFKLKDMIYEYPLPIIMATLIKEGDISSRYWSISRFIHGISEQIGWSKGKSVCF